MVNEQIQAWCECYHHEAWHMDGGPCTYVTTVLDDSGEWQVDSPDCGCTHLRLSHVEVMV